MYVYVHDPAPVKHTRARVHASTRTHARTHTLSILLLGTCLMHEM